MILALVSLYPVLAALLGVLTTGLFFFAGTSHFVVAALLYAIVPPGSFNPWFSKAHEFIQWTGLWDPLVRNCRLTFQYHEKERPARALYLWHPHGLMSMSPMLHCVADKHSRLATLKVFHQMPVVRDLYTQVGAIPADQDILKQHLLTESVSVIPGGVRDMMTTTPGVIHIVPRKGVFRLALETGTPIVPVLTYGENELFPAIHLSFNEWLQSRWKWIVPLPQLTGIRNWLQLAEAPLPPIHSQAGHALPVERCEAPTEAQVIALRQAQEVELQRLFDATSPKGQILRFATDSSSTLKRVPQGGCKSHCPLPGRKLPTPPKDTPSPKPEHE